MVAYRMPVQSIMSDERGRRSERDLRIDITSDIICPWCLVGVKQLLLAVDEYNVTHADTPLNPLIRLLPYELIPGLSKEPMDKMAMKISRFGEVKAAEMTERMNGKLKGLGYHRTPTSGQISSTHLAHRLLTYTLIHKTSAQLPLAMDLFESHHIDGQYPAHIPTLAALSVKHGIFDDEGDAREWLEGDECDAEVRSAYAMSRRLGVTGVPFFVFEGKWAVSGALGVEEFVGLLEDIVRRQDEALVPSPTSTAVSPTAQHNGEEGELDGQKIHAHGGHGEKAICE